jgi:DNA helicase HerA-like ATPase
LRISTSTQLPTELRQAVLANARTKIVFQSSADDARTMAREFGSSVTDKDFMHLGKYEAIARLSTGDGVSSPLTLVTKEPATPYGRQRAVRYVSRQKYGRPVGQVEADMEARRRVEKTPNQRRRPKVSGEGWETEL